MGVLKDDQIGKIILVLSGKGGVGKSTFSVLLANYLSQKNKKVGLLDLDLCGPSIGKMLSFDSETNILNTTVNKGSNNEWIPVQIDENLCCVSMSYFLENKDDAIIWRGPKKNAMIKELIENVKWNYLDFLIIDTPPGTSDEHISIAEYFYGKDNVGGILITTPQKVSINDVKRQITFCQKTQINILGIVENMSFFICPNCQFHNKLLNNEEFGGAKKLCDEFNLKLIGSLPFCYLICACLDKGINPFNIEKVKNYINLLKSTINDKKYFDCENSYNIFEKNFSLIINFLLF